MTRPHKELFFLISSLSLFYESEMSLSPDLLIGFPSLRAPGWDSSPSVSETNLYIFGLKGVSRNKEQHYNSQLIGSS